MNRDLADQVASQISNSPEDALRLHVREELGVEYDELPSPLTAAVASLLTFALGALVPLLPYIVGFNSLWGALLLAAIVAFTGGGLVARITNQRFLSRRLRQLALAGAAASLTYMIVALVGASVG